MGNPSPDAGVLRITIGAAPPDRLDKALARDVPEEAALSRSLHRLKGLQGGQVHHVQR